MAIREGTAYKPPKPVRLTRPSPSSYSTLENQNTGSSFTREGQLVIVCSVMTLSHTLMSLEKSGLVGKQGDCTSLGWFDLMALPDVHMKPTVPTPGESVGVCSMATCFQNAQFNMKKVAMPIIPPMKWLTKPHSTRHCSDILSMCGGLQSCTKCRVEKCSIVHWLPEGELWRSHGKLYSCELLLWMCSSAAIGPGRPW